jgi:gas vesicle protein
MSSGKVVMGVLAGMAVGALLGVLFAPDKGSETRKKMAEKGGDMADGVKDKLNKLIDELNRKIDEAKAKVNDNTTNVTSTSEEMN